MPAEKDPAPRKRENRVEWAHGTPILVDSTWTARVDLGGDLAILFYGDDDVRFHHLCDRGKRGIVICAPRLQIGRGHSVVRREPLTIVASVMCDDCGTHGFVTDGAWVSV